MNCGSDNASGATISVVSKVSPRARKVIRVVVTVVVLILIGVLFGKSLVENWAQVEAQHLGFSWWMVAAVLAFAAAVPVSGLLWRQLVNHLSAGPKAGVREAIAVHCASWLLKYVPGQIGSLLNKVLWGQRKGISRTLIAITFVYENVFLVLGAAVPSVVILAGALGLDIFGSNVGTLILPLLAIIPLVAISNRTVFRLALTPVTSRVLKQKLTKDSFLSTPYTLLFQLEYLVPRLMNGLGFLFVVAALFPVEPSAWLPLAAAYMLAGAAGILAIFVPSGLGVREAVIVLFASQYMTVPQAILASLLARLLSTIGDGVVALIYAGFRFTLPKADPAEESKEVVA